MALSKLVRLRAAQGDSGAFNQIDATVAASQTIKQGDIVSLSSGKVQQALSLPGSDNLVGISSGNTATLGIAQADITTDSNGLEVATGRTTIPVAIWDGNLEATLRIVAKDGSSKPDSANSFQTNITLGTSYRYCRVRITATNWFYALYAEGTPTNGELRVVELSPESSSAEQFGLVTVRYISSTTDTVRQL